MTAQNKIIGFLLLVVVVLILILVFRKPETVVEEFDDSQLRQEIQESNERAAYWQKEADRWHAVADSAVAEAEKAAETDTIIKHHYHEIYKFNSTATNYQLDSIIRANWFDSIPGHGNIVQ